MWLLCGGALVCFVLWRRRGKREDADRGPNLRACAGLSLGREHRLHVVEWEGRRLLIATGTGAAPNLLLRLDQSELEGLPCGKGGARAGH